MTSLFLPKAPRRDFSAMMRRESGRRMDEPESDEPGSDEPESTPAWWVGLVLAMFVAALVFFSNPSIVGMG